MIAALFAAICKVPPWIYCSSMIFLPGAGFAKVYAATHGSRTDEASLKMPDA